MNIGKVIRIVTVEPKQAPVHVPAWPKPQTQPIPAPMWPTKKPVEVPNGR